MSILYANSVVNVYFQPADDGYLKECFMVISYVPPGAQKGFIMAVLDTNTEDDMVSKLRDLGKVDRGGFYLAASYDFLVSKLKSRSTSSREVGIGPILLVELGIIKYFA